MEKMYKIFTLSPGSTSTKIAVFENEKELFKANVTHEREVLAGFANVNDQFPYREETIRTLLEEAGIELGGMDAFVALSGGLESMEGGVYPVNEAILRHSREGRRVKHPAMLGAQLVEAFHKQYGAPAFLVNPPDVDEFQELARISGLKGVYRESRLHALNQKEVAIRCAKELGKRYEECNFVVCHIGGGLSVAAHKKGKMIDGNDVLNGDGPMAPNRAGQVPAVPVIRMCFSGEFTEKEMIEKIGKTGGLLGHLGTDDTREISRRIDAGDGYAKLIADAMAYQLTKAIGSYGVVLQGEVDAILLTGGVSNWSYFTDFIRNWCSWIAPVKKIFDGLICF